MDEINRLEREIRDLQRELNSQNVQANNTRQQLVSENRRALDLYKRDMESALRNHDEQTQREYERLLEQYRMSVEQELQLTGSRMEVDYQMLLADVKRNEALLEAKNRELESLIQSLKADFGKQRQGNALEAEKYIADAAAVCTVVGKKPHEKFMSGQFHNLSDTVEDSRRLFSAGMFEAATAVAISARSGIERLDIELEEKIEEWDRYYKLFETEIDMLSEKFKDGLASWCRHIDTNPSPDREEKRLRLIELNYWSKGKFERLFADFLAMQRLRVQISAMGKEAYLAQPGGEDVQSLRNKIEAIRNTGKQLDAGSALLVSVYDASCERSMWGEKIIAFLTEELNLVWLENRSGFRIVDEKARAQRDFLDYIRDCCRDESICEDTREWLELAFETASETLVFVYIIPVENKNLVTNQVIMHIEYFGPEQGEYSRDIFTHICESIEVEDINSGVVQYAADINQLKVSGNKVLRETAAAIEEKKQTICNRGGF